MDTLAAVVAIIGIVVAASAWHLVATGRDVWRTIPPVFAVLGLLPLLFVSSLEELPAGAGRDVGGTLEIALGVGSGAVLYVATRGFVVVPATSWPTTALLGEWQARWHGATADPWGLGCRRSAHRAVHLRAEDRAS